MFDSVGKNLDEDAARRSALSAAIAGGLGIGAGVLVFAAGLLAVKEVVLDPISADEIVEVEVADAELDLAPPPPPPPPPPAAAEAVDEEEEEEEETPTPDEMVEEVQKLDEKIEQDMKSDVKPAGQAGGVEGGVEGGVVGGVIGGVEGGVVGGQLGGGVKRVHHTAVQSKRLEPKPMYPAAARGMNMGEQRCKVTVDLDTEGVPSNVRIETCPKVFHPGTEEAVLKWRWYPYRENGQKLRVQTTVIVTYREE